jgi:TolB-like protein/Tfp pilus assembly protein PilF
MEVISGFIQQHRGRVVATGGDSVLAEFASVVDAVRSAVGIQEELKDRNKELPEDRRMEFRVGVNLGDVVEEGDNILGDGVNVAARVQSVAEAGGICISGTVYDQIKNKLAFSYDFIGEQAVKNIKEQVRIYRVRLEPEDAFAELGQEKRWVGKRLSKTAMVIMAVILIAVGAILYQFVLRQSSKTEVASKEKMAFPLPDKPSIAVLPFVNMSEDPSQEYFSDGMTEDLITDLSKISGLLVIARNSTFTYKGKAVKVKQVAEDLGVRYVLEGSVRRAGDLIRINAQLIDALTGHHLWAERYDGKMDEIFSLQDQITKKIVSALAVQLESGEKEVLERKGTNNVKAYDAFLEGWDHYYRSTPDSFAKSLAFFKQAIDLDPNYPDPYASLAIVFRDATNRSVLLSGLKMSWLEARLRMREYAELAMKKPTSTAYQVSAFSYLFRRQHKEAISELEQGFALNPNSSRCLSGMGYVLPMAGKPKEGIEYLKKWIRVDPRNRYGYLNMLSFAHFCAGETAEAATVLEQALRLNPEDGSIATGLAAFYGALGRDQEALSTFEIRRKKPNPPTGVEGPMFIQPFKDRAVAERYFYGLLKAGVPPAKISGGYFPAFPENQLSGREIKGLLFGSTITGSTITGPYSDGRQWSRSYRKDGEFTWHAVATVAGPGDDTGKSRIEGDMICHQFQKSYWGIEYCGTVFRNPRGTIEGKDEYFFCNDFGFSNFSIVR